MIVAGMALRKQIVNNIFIIFMISTDFSQFDLWDDIGAVFFVNNKQ
jgi:hypothetical protein